MVLMICLCTPFHGETELLTVLTRQRLHRQLRPMRSCPRNNMPWKFILLFENGPACFQGSCCAPGVRSHFTIGKAHLVPIEGLTEDYRGQFGNCLWSDLTTFGDLSAAIPMMLLQLLDSSTHTVKRGVVPGQDQ